MKNRFLFLLLFCYCPTVLFAQNQNRAIDSLVSVLKTSKEDAAKVNVLNSISVQFINVNDYEKAKQYANTALALAGKINFKKGEAMAYNILGGVEDSRGNYPDALKNYFESLKISKDIGDKQGMSNSYNNIGIIYFNQGNYAEALNFYSETLKIDSAFGNKGGIASTSFNIGVIYSNQGNYAIALNKFLVSLKAFEEIDYKNGIALSYMNIGIINLKKGNYPEALKNQLASLKINEEIGNKHGMALTYNNIADIYSTQKNYAESLKYDSASLKLFEELGEKQGISKQYGNLGATYLSMGDYQKAMGNNSMALKIAEEIGDNYGVANSYSILGEILKEQGNYQDALVNYFASLKISEEIGRKEGIVESSELIGNILIKQGTLEDSSLRKIRFNEARQYLNKGLVLAKEIGHKEFIKDCNRDLSELENAEGNFAQALEHYKLYTLYKDSILNEESNKQTAQLKIQYETEKKDHEIEALNKENEIKALQVKQEHTSMLASKLETEKKQNEIVLLNTTKELQDLELKKQKDELEKKQLEAEVKNKEVILLAQKSEIQQASIQGQQLIRNAVIIFCVILFVLAGLLFNRFKLKKKIESQLALLNERKRISTELHDDLGAQLSTARMFINNLRNNAGADGNHTLIENSLNLIDSSINDLRKIMDDLQSSTLQEQGYVAATEELVNKINQLQQINFALTHHGIDNRFDHKTEHNLFRITQELINNTLKYAKAKNVSLDLVKRDDKIVLMYEDDGEGFDIQSVKRGYGLSNIESRAQALAGTAEFDSKPGAGSRTIIEMPLVYAGEKV